MRFAQQYRNAQLLFGLSLILLLGFLGLWLSYVYQDKVEEFERQVSYSWLKSIKEVESKDFSKLIITTINDRTNATVSLNPVTYNDTLLKDVHTDSHGTMSLSPNYAIGTRADYEELELVLDSPVQTVFIRKATFVESDDTVLANKPPLIPPALRDLAAKIPKDVSTFIKEFELDLDLVQQKLDSNLQQADLNVAYQIQTLDDTLQRLSPLMANDQFFVRTATGAAFTLEIARPSYRLWSSMWLEGLMGLFLLSVISAAFYYMLHHLKAQHQLVQMKNDFISNITHELRTPIFTVSAALEALDNFKGLDNPERTQEYLSISKNELNRLSILVEKVLKTSLLEQSALTITKEPLALLPLVQQMVHSFKLQLEQENATITIHPFAPHLQVYADKIHLTNVLYNLIDNALKYRSARPPRIDIQLQAHQQHLEIRIRDNSIGIPEAYVGTIFNKFSRVPQGNQHNVKGYGLGLHYAAHVIELHGGTITVDSQVDQGSTFIITLPQHTTHE